MGKPPTKNAEFVPKGWPGRPVCRSIQGMGAFGTIANFAVAIAALVVAGPYWAVIVFLSVALVRVTLDSHVLRRDHELLQERFARLESRPDLEADLDAPPASGTRSSRTLLAKRAS